MSRARITAGIAAVLALAWLASCGDDDQRDQHYGTDVGANYQVPEGGVVPTPDTPPDADAATDTAAGASDGDAGVPG